MSNGTIRFEMGRITGDLVLPSPPDCARWVRRNIEINGVLYAIVRRPRLFRFAALLETEDPEYIDRGELPDGRDPEDGEYLDRVLESKLWCLEFDVDIQGGRKTLRVQFLWRDFPPFYNDIEQTSAFYPQGVRTYLGHWLYPVTVHMNQALPRDCEMDAPLGVWKTVHEIRYVEYKPTPFGMLEEDREEAERQLGGERPLRLESSTAATQQAEAVSLSDEITVEEQSGGSVQMEALTAEEIAEAAGSVRYVEPQKVGRLRVFDADWRMVTFQDNQVRLSSEKIRVFRTMHRLGAVSEETAKTKKEILQEARLPRVNRSLSNVLCTSGDKKAVYAEIYAACISKVDGLCPKYYLTQ